MVKLRPPLCSARPSPRIRVIWNWGSWRHPEKSRERWVL